MRFRNDEMDVAATPTPPHLAMPDILLCSDALVLEHTLPKEYNVALLLLP